MPRHDAHMEASDAWGIGGTGRPASRARHAGQIEHLQPNPETAHVVL